MNVVGVGAASVELTEHEAIKRAAPGLASARLWYSCERQRGHASEHARTPAVLWSRWDGGSFAFGMQRITGWVHPLQQPVEGWLDAAASLVDEARTDRMVSADRVRVAVSRKLSALARAVPSEHGDTYRGALAGCARAVSRAMPDVPFGRPHGDFTTCNMLLRSDGELHVIDYLDSEVPSPVVDVAKLRQDTRWGWAAAHGVASDSTACSADRWWVARWSAEPWWPWVPPLTALALLRAVPYVRDAAIRAWLVGQAAEACAEAACDTR